jgi:hypothetical protein
VKIDRYRFGEIVISGESYSHDIMLVAGRVVKWWRRTGHEVAVVDLTEIIAAGPEVVIIGTGAYGAVRILPETGSFLASKGIKLIALPSQQACEKYNELRSKHQVAAAFHLTC